MPLSLKQRLLAVEDEFVSALAKGGDALVTFENRWEILLKDIDSASLTGLDDEVLAIAHATSMRLAALADTSLELFDSYNEITSKLIDQVDSLMGELSLMDHPPNQTINYRSWSESTLSNHSVPSSIYPPQSTPRKRRRSSSSGVETPIQVKKRQRISSFPPPLQKRVAPKPRSSVRVSPCISSPSPKLAYTYPNVASSPQLPSAPPAHISRKRRLSDADISITQSQRRLHVGPRLHAVSDTFLAPPSEYSCSIDDTTLPSGAGLGMPTVSFPSVEDLHSLDVLATTSDAQRSLVNLDPTGGFDICPFFACAQDLVEAVPESPSLDGLLQSLINPTVSSQTSTPAATWSLGDDEDNISMGFISSPGSTPSPSSTPSCPATPLLDDDLDLQAPFRKQDLDSQLPLWVNELLFDPFAVDIDELDNGKHMVSSIPINVVPSESPSWGSTADVLVHLSSELPSSASFYTPYLTPSIAITYP